MRLNGSTALGVADVPIPGVQASQLVGSPATVYEEHSLCHRSTYTVDLFSLAQQSLPEERVAGAGGEQAFVDDPGVGLYMRAPQVLLQSAGLGHRGGFRQGDQQDARIGGVLETCLLYTSPSPRDGLLSRMPSSA